ncbi:hypothetical protein MMC07_000981 [Pseudocyphellaria aurata]|nr:hypothetical protein [Pseudocyphellaria aurata]
MFESKTSLRTDSIAALKKLSVLINRSFHNVLGYTPPLDLPLIGEIRHEIFRPRAVDALQLLQKVASLVLPIMRPRGLHVGLLSEFWPSWKGLLAQNHDQGRKIFLRLRDPHDERRFLPLDCIIDAMLHELAHNLHPDHDPAFFALWDQLRAEFFNLAVAEKWSVRNHLPPPPPPPGKSSGKTLHAPSAAPPVPHVLPKLPSSAEVVLNARAPAAFWRCRYCNTKNRGTDRSCHGCGMERWGALNRPVSEV